MENLSLLVLPNLEDQGKELIANPANSHVLLWNIRPSIKPIGPGKDLLRFFKADTPFGIRPQPLTLSRTKVKRIRYHCYTTSVGDYPPQYPQGSGLINCR